MFVCKQLSQGTFFDCFQVFEPRGPQKAPPFLVPTLGGSGTRAEPQEAVTLTSRHHTCTHVGAYVRCLSVRPLAVCSQAPLGVCRASPNESAWRFADSKLPEFPPLV